MCVDATDAMKGNWLRYVNWARSSEEQNLFPLEINRAIYYKALRVSGRASGSRTGLAGGEPALGPFPPTPEWPMKPLRMITYAKPCHFGQLGLIEERAPSRGKLAYR